MTDEFATTERTQLKRVPERGHFDRDVVNAIICHVDIVDEEDMDADVWAGLLPIETTFGEPSTAEDMRMELPPSPSVANYQRPV